MAAAGWPQWTQGLRLIGREVKDSTTAPRAAWSGPARLQSDFSQAALARSFQEVVDDKTQPAARRMHALLLLAGIDQARGNAEAAITSYNQVFAYFQEQPNPALQTVVLLQLGEAYHRQQRLREARAAYERALTPAAAAPVPLCVVLLAKNLGDVAFLEQRYADAATCYKTWHRLASHLGDSEGEAAAQLRLGLAQDCLAQATAPAQLPRHAETPR